jgi:hypothetical protein
VNPRAGERRREEAPWGLTGFILISITSIR